MSNVVGVLALQGDFAKHMIAIENCGADAREVRTPKDLATCDRLIIPGGESTTLGILLKLSGLDKEITVRGAEGMPVWGTCMGMILLAKEVEGRSQFTFGLLDITVRRNAFGAQVHSFEADVDVVGLDEPFHAVFIRSPEVIQMGHGVEKISELDGHILGVRRGKLLGTSFHPELTQDARLHELFLAL